MQIFQTSWNNSLFYFYLSREFTLFIHMKEQWCTDEGKLDDRVITIVKYGLAAQSLILL